MKDYLTCTAAKYNDDDRQDKDIAGHSMIRTLLHITRYKFMKDAQFADKNSEGVHRRYGIHLSLRRTRRTTATSLRD
eukprot:1954548-Amphidinium_carterae.1